MYKRTPNLKPIENNAEEIRLKIKWRKIYDKATEARNEWAQQFGCKDFADMMIQGRRWIENGRQTLARFKSVQIPASAERAAQLNAMIIERLVAQARGK